MAKVQPAVVALNFRVPCNGISFIDLNFAKSLVNRRFYRQGTELVIQSIDWHLAPVAADPGNLTESGVVTVQTLPHTWVAANAWEKSFRLWDQMNKQVLSLDPSIKPRFYDFKIFFDDDHESFFRLGDGFQNNFTPANGETLIPISWEPSSNQQHIIDVTGSEWDYSHVQIPNAGGVPGATEERNLHMIGPSVATSVPMIQGYCDSRSAPQSPDPVTTGAADTTWMVRLFDVGDNLPEITADLEDDNDELPYAQLDYPGGDTNQVHGEVCDMIVDRNTIGLSHKSTAGFTAPCGLLKFDSDGFTLDPSEDPVHWITIYLVPGGHRGYMERSMTKM